MKIIYQKAIPFCIAKNIVTIPKIFHFVLEDKIKANFFGTPSILLFIMTVFHTLFHIYLPNHPNHPSQHHACFLL